MDGDGVGLDLGLKLQTVPQHLTCHVKFKTAKILRLLHLFSVCLTMPESDNLSERNLAGAQKDPAVVGLASRNLECDMMQVAKCVHDIKLQNTN